MKNDNVSRISSLAAMIIDNDLCRKIADSLKPAVSGSDSAAANSVRMLLNTYLRMKNIKLPGYIKVIEHVMKKLECTMTEPDENGEITSDFSKAEYIKLRDVYRQIENERPYIIENLLVNIVFSQDMQQGLWKNYFILAVFYNMLGIIAPAFLNEEYSDKELALALTYAAKLVIYTHSAEKGTFNDFVKENKCTMPYAAFLIC